MNISDVNSHIQWMSSSLSALTLLLLGGGFLLLIVILGVLANITVCIVMLRNRRFKKHVSNFMLAHLAITDVVHRLIVVPVQLIAMFIPLQNKPVLLCKVTKTLLHSVRTAVFTSLVMIASDRHQSITKPFQRLHHKPKFYLYVSAVWGYSIISAMPKMYSEGIQSHVYNFTLPNDQMNKTYSWHVCSSSKGSTERALAAVCFFLGFLAPLIIITVAYSKMTLYLWKKSRNRATNQAALKSKGKALRMLMLLVLGFVVCLGIPQVNDFLDSFGSYYPAFFLLALVLQLSSSLVNPVIYGFYSAEFKQGLQNRKIRWR